MKTILQALCMLMLGAGSLYAQTSVQEAVQNFTSQTGATATIDKATGSLSFLKFPSQVPFQSNGANATEKSVNFFRDHGQLLGMRASVDDFRFVEDKTGGFGLETVTMQQTYRGVPVFDGVIKFHFAGNLGLTSLNGNYVADIKVDPVPVLPQGEAERLAIAYIGAAGEKPIDNPLRAHKSTIYIFQKGLAQGYKGASYLVYEVEVRNDADVREFLYIDAHNGRLIEQFTGTHSINRTLYENSITPSNIRWKEGDAFPGTLDVWQRSEVETSAFIYNLMKNSFGRISYDGNDAPMITVNNSPGIQCPNATWNGVSANYCTGIASDDVVAHEWAHAYTEYTSGLIYAWQAGAMNEAYSDIWGETVDILDNYMDEGENVNQVRTGCGSSTRWQLAEKTTSFGGALRDMWNPTCLGDPGKVSDPEYYCANGDNGGVHINSGVLNHAYALLVDGGNYNGQNITGIGLTKAAHIFWLAQSEYMTRTTDFAAQADLLEAAADFLEGKPLTSLTTGTAPAGVSGESIDGSDIEQLSKVIAAVELRRETSCGFQTMFTPAPPLCEGARSGLAFLHEGFENGLGAFTTGFTTASSTFETRQWSQADGPENHGKAAYAIDFPGGDCSGPSQEGIIWLRSPDIQIPAGTAGNINLAFDHYVSVEPSYDGGNVKYSVNGGPWILVPASAFMANPYNDVLSKYVSQTVVATNPLAGEPAFSGTDDGTLSGTWGQSQVDLSSLGVEAGDVVRLSWEFGTDQCNGYDGWYVDDVSVYSCAVTPAVHFASEGTTVSEGEAVSTSACLDYVDKKIFVGIDVAPSAPVTVTFKNPGGTAKNGFTGDYTISPASVTLQAGALSADLTVRVYNDAYVEGTETVDVSYTLNANGGNAYAAVEQQVFSLTIADDDLPPGNYTEELLSANFNTTQQGFKVINGGTSRNSWTRVAPSSQTLDPAGRPFFRVTGNDVIRNDHVSDEILESPPINTLGKKNMVLSFYQGWLPYQDGVPESGMVDIWDGQQWHNVMTINEASGSLGNIFNGTPDIRNIPIPDQYANVSMKIRFHYIARLAFHWAVDNIKLTASNSTDIQSAVSAGNGAREYLGPNETAVFYDPGTSNLIAKIKNLSDHDYGCTTVQVDHAGTDEMPWVKDFSITKKTFKVTPTINNPNGQYEITLYYKKSELPNFNGSDITSMGKSAGSIGPENTAATSFAEVQVSSAFNTDLAYTSTFNSGFSGFGLSNAPPAGSLPVTLIELTGERTPEGNLLKWRTASETDNDHFIIEKTYDGRVFEEIGKVTGRGTTTITTSYRFTDPLVNLNTAYYRLKQVDVDGTFAYSRIISISSDEKPEVKFFPNPVQSDLVVQMPEKGFKSYEVKVIDTRGRAVISTQKAKRNDGTLTLDMQKLPSGVYQVIITAAGLNYSIPVVKL
jgi:Zn-dependent metalloprotease